jgi:hypothetical protein
MGCDAKLGGIGQQGASCRQCVELFNDTMIVIRQWLHEKALRSRAQQSTREEWNGSEQAKRSGCTG